MTLYATGYVSTVWRVAKPHGRALDIGARNPRDQIRSLHHDWWGIDLLDGPGVDEIADGADYDCEPVSVVLAVEVFEHTPRWEEIIQNAERLLEPGGYLIATMAGPDCPPHSIDGGPVKDGEHFETIQPDALANALRIFRRWSIDSLGHDLRCWARK
jgi:SAM-dependent methyltransferase